LLIETLELRLQNLSFRFLASVRPHLQHHRIGLGWRLTASHQDRKTKQDQQRK
jgi:hypothetical protein